MKPTPTPEMIERIAKIIDKSAWQAIEDGRDALPHSLWGVRRDGARHTAAEVIAALSVPAEAVVGEPVAFRWKLRENCPWGYSLFARDDVYVCEPLYAAPSAPDGWQSHDIDHTAGRKLSLWFFRDLSGEQRGKLFGLFGMNDAQKDTNHGYQAMALAQVVRALAAAKGGAK